MPPRRRGSNGDHTGPSTRSLPPGATLGTSRHIKGGSNQQQPRSGSPQGVTVKVEDTSTDTMSTEDEFKTDDYSTGDDISTSESEDQIIRTTKRPMINLPPGRYIVCGIPGHLYVDELSATCVWGNTVSLYRDHVIRLRHPINNKKTSIPYYVCHLNKKFAAPTQRMYFKTHFSKTHLFQHMHGKINTLPITSADRSIRVSARLIKGVDNRATITAGWKVFISHTDMIQENIYVFAFKPAAAGLRLTVYSL